MREVFGVNFDGAYERSNVILALADLVSQDDPNKPIIALHQVGSNNISELSISQEEKEEFNKKTQVKHVDDNIKGRLLGLSKSAIRKEFDHMFALLKEKKRPILYVRWVPKDDEVFMASRPNHFGHFICLSFFCDHNNAKSILISNPNGHEINDENEVTAISSYLEKNSDVKVYHTRDYLQFDNTFCSPGSLITLRALYNMDWGRLNEVLQNGQQKNMGNSSFKYISIELGNSILQKEIGKIPQGEDEQRKVAQVLREIDYDTAKACKDAEKLVNVADDGICLPIFLNEVSFEQKLVEGNFTQDQKKY